MLLDLDRKIIHYLVNVFKDFTIFSPLLPTGMSTKSFSMVKGEKRSDREKAVRSIDQLLLILLLLLLNAVSSEFALRFL